MIGLAVQHPLWLLLLVLAPGAYLAWRRWPPPVPRGRARLILISRVLLIAFLVVALAGVRLTTLPAQRAVVAVVDLSASVKAGQGLDAEAATVRALQAGKGPDDLFGVVSFGHQPVVEVPLTRDPAFDTFQSQPDPSYTDIAGALRLAAGLIPDGYARQLVLISDGRENLEDSASAVSALQAEGVRVDVLAVGGAPSAEALVTSVDVPSQLRVGQVADVDVHLQSSGPATGSLTLMVDGQELATRAINLPAGSSVQSFQVPDLAVGLRKVRAELTAQPDTYPENNVGESAIRVTGRPLVLVLEGKAGEGENVQAALEASGMNVERRPSAGAPTDTATLGRYDSTVVVDAPADGFPGGSMAALAASVHDLGRGLVTIGGPTAYGPGGWQGTPLEDAAPVKMEIPNRKDKPKVAVVLVMETMEDQRADQVVLSAAESVIDQLTPNDMVAVTDGSNGFLVNMTQVKDKAAIDRQLESAQLGDAFSYLGFMRMAVDALQKTDAPLKHIVVLGDGDAPDQQQAVQSFLADAQTKNVTTSSIGVDVHGQPQFMSYMQDIARWGGGRFYESNNPSQVPQLLLKESMTALRPWFEQYAFFPSIASGGNLLQGVPTDSFPQLNGYVVTTPKPTAEQYLISTKQDPVLAAWQYGLGRSVAWTSDSKGVWTSGFLSSPVSALLFARMVEWTLPNPDNGEVKVSAQPSGDGLEVTVTGPQTSGATVSVGVVSPDLQSSSTSLVTTSPGKWQGRISGATVGVYLVHAAIQKGGQTLGQGDAAVSVPYSPEYLQLGRDDGLLKLLAKNGSGVLLAKPQQAWGEHPLPVPVSNELFWVLLLLAALLWPLDVAARRITLRPRQLAANVIQYARERRMEDLEVAAPAELVRLRSRVESIRRRPSGGPDVAASVASPAPGEVGRPAPPRPPPTSPEKPAPSEEEEALSARLLEARRKKRGSGS
jgi:hypothetical protein